MCCCLLLMEKEPMFSIFSPFASGSHGSQTPQKISVYGHGRYNPVQLGGEDVHFRGPAVP